MLLVTVLTLGAAGALGAATAGLVIKDKVNRRRAYYLVFSLSFLLVMTLMNKFVAPQIYGYLEAEELEEELQKNPAFVAMRQYDRPLYDESVAEAKAAVRNGISSEQILGLMRDKIAPVVQGRIGHASDGTIVRFVQVSQKQLRNLQKRGDGTCYAYMFPTPGPSLVDPKYFDQSITQEELRVTGEVIRDSATSKQVLPTAEEVRPQLELIARALLQRYSQEEMLMLQNPRQPGIDKEKVCEMSIAMYDQVMALPLEQQGPLLRYMLGVASPSL